MLLILGEKEKNAVPEPVFCLPEDSVAAELLGTSEAQKKRTPPSVT